MNQFKKCAKIADIKRLMVGRKLLVRSGDARFGITKASFFETIKHLSKPTFEIEFSDSSLYIETTHQNQEVFANIQEAKSLPIC